MGNYNDILMEQLASGGDGNYSDVDTLDQARVIFVENLTGTLQVIAREAKVQVDFNPKVVSRYRLLGYENRRVADQDFRNDAVDAGEVGAGHSVTALYELKLLDSADSNVATVSLRYQDPDSGEVVEMSRELDRGEIRSKFAESSPRFSSPRPWPSARRYCARATGRRTEVSRMSWSTPSGSESYCPMTLA